MSPKIIYTIFGGAIIGDSILLPIFSAPPWFPSVLMASLPFLFLFSAKREVFVIFSATAIFFWLAGGISLGVVVLALGMMVFFERWLILQFFQHGTWQALTFSALSVMVFAVFAMVFDLIVVSGAGFLKQSFAVKMVLSTCLAAAFSLYLKKFISNSEHEKAIF